MMKRQHLLILVGIAAMLGMASTTALAQNDEGPGGRRGGRDFDPEQMRQRMMENIRDQMSVTNADEWKVLEARIQKVMDARREAGPAGNFGRMMRRRGGNEGDMGPGQGPGGGRRGGFFGGQPMPEQEALDKAIDSNAPTEQIKAAMEKYRAARKAKEAALEKAQADLKQVLSVKQEAVALSLGLLN